jgi:hypothetical protein
MLRRLLNIASIVCLVLCVALVKMRATFSDDMTTLRDRFVSEAPVAWSEAEQWSKNLQLEANVAETNLTEDFKSWTIRRRTTVKCRDGLILQEITESPPEGAALPANFPRPTSPQSRVDAINDEHSFSLRKEGNAKWVVQSVGAVNDNLVVSSIQRRGRILVLWPWSISNWSLAKMYASPGFHLDKVEEVPFGQDTFVKVWFTYDPRSDGDENVIRSGWVVLNPKAKWAVQSCEANLKYPNRDRARITIVNTYKVGNDVQPMQAKFSLVHPQKTGGVDETIDFVTYEQKIIPRAEFTMVPYATETSDDHP